MRHPIRFAALALATVAILIPVRAAAHGRSDDAYVLFLDKHSVTMSGSLDDLREARAAREKNRGSTLWFRQAGTEYVIGEPDVIREFAGIHAAEGDNDARQERLDRDIEELDGRLEDLSERKDDLEDRVGDREQLAAVSSKIDRLNAQQEDLGREIERATAETDHRIRELLLRAIASGAAREVGSSKP